LDSFRILLDELHLLQDAGQDDDELLPAPSLDIAWPPG